MESELKPCPHTHGTGGTNPFRIVCSACGEDITSVPLVERVAAAAPPADKPAQSGEVTDEDIAEALRLTGYKCYDGAINAVRDGITMRHALTLDRARTLAANRALTEICERQSASLNNRPDEQDVRIAALTERLRVAEGAIDRAISAHGEDAQSTLYLVRRILRAALERED